LEQPVHKVKGKKAIHMSDINDLGKVVAGAFLQPEKAGNGNYFSLATELNSFNDVIEAYKAIGKEYSFTQMPAELYSTFFEGAKELAEMFRYFEKYTYMGPGSEQQIGMAKKIATHELVTFEEWIKQNR
jgi:hypothetical protein